MIKAIFGFLALSFTGGLILYILLDLKPWRKDSKLWKKRKND